MSSECEKQLQESFKPDYSVPCEEGSFGMVYVCKDPDFVVKIVPGYPCEKDSYLTELHALKKIGDHPNICPLVDYELDSTNSRLKIVMPRFPHTLSRMIDRMSSLPGEEDLCMVARCLLNGLACCHENGVVHCDIKPANIVLKNYGEVSLIDFGISEFFDFGRREIDHPLDRDVTSSWYRAPELWDSREPFTEKIDVWSLGCVLYEFATGWPLVKCEDESKSFWSKVEKLVRDFSSGKGRTIFHRVESFGELGNGLMEKLLALDPCERPSAREALSHPWFFNSE